MTPIQLSRESLTFYVLDTYAKVEKATDTCSLRWQLCRAVLTILLIILVGATVGLFILDTLVWIVAMIVMGMFIVPSILAFSTVALTAIISTIAGLAAAADAFNAWRWRRRDEAATRPPGALTVAYRSLKEKYCTPVEFV